MKQSKDFYAYLASAVVIYFLILIPANYIPFHSDDYLYYLRGISFEALFKQYMNWGGRLIGDYTGSLLLHFLSRRTYMALNSLVFLIVIIQISFIPSAVNQKPVINIFNTILLWLAFFLYWLCNPCLGQTSFWIIGSIIYLWPLMWAGSYILWLIRMLQKNGFGAETNGYLKSLNEKLPKKESVRKQEMFLLGVFGFFAGLSNEATGATVVFFSLVLYLFFRYRERTKQLWAITLNGGKEKLVLLIGIFSTLAGFLVLVLAPGNFVRLNWVEFADWHKLSLISKISFHVFRRFPIAISRFWLAFLVIAVLLVVLANPLRSKYKYLKSGCNIVAFLFIVTAALSVFSPIQFKCERIIFLVALITYEVIAYVFYKTLQSKLFMETGCRAIEHYGITTLFFVMAIFSISIFIVSPFMPQRTLNTFNFCIVLTIIMLADGVFRQLAEDSKLNYYIGLLFLLCVLCFLFSYSRFTYAVMQTQVQSEIRDDIISEAKIRNCEQAEIPDWYFTKLAKSTDKFDLFRSGAMPEYYGIKTITWKPANFNYAILKSKKPVIEGFQVTDRIKMNVYYDNSFRFFDEPSFIFGYDYLPLPFASNSEGKIYFTFRMKDNHSTFVKSKVTIVESINKYTKVGDCYYFVVRLNDKIKVRDIKCIDIAFSAQETGAELFSIPICVTN